MERKIFVIVCCTLLITTTIPAIVLVAGTNEVHKTMELASSSSLTLFSIGEAENDQPLLQSTPPSMFEQSDEGSLREPREITIPQEESETCDCDNQPDLITTSDNTKQDDLVHRLHDAKINGDHKAVMNLEKKIASDHNSSISYLKSNDDVSDDESQVIVFSQDGETLGDGGETRGTDILVAGSNTSEINPSLTSDQDGILWVAVEHAGATDKNITIYRSITTGQTWSPWLQVYTPLEDCTNPSLTIGYGEEDWLFLAYTSGGKKINVLRIAPTNPSINDFSLIEYDQSRASHPRIVTDCTEFGQWYVYLIYNKEMAGQTTYWTVRFSRSLDFGGNWTLPTTIASYCQSDYYNALNAHPDIDYGSDVLFVAYDNYPPGCTGTNRDIYVVKSVNYGGSWWNPLQLTSDADDEFDPSLGAVKNFSTSTAVVAFTRYYDALDYDVWYKYTQNSGLNWSTYHCLSCDIGGNEKRPDVMTSFSRGKIHAGYWYNGNISYRGTGYQTPSSWSAPLVVNEGKKASSSYARPSLGVNPLYPVAEESMFAWTDYRNSATMYDVYFDALYFAANAPPNLPSNPSPANQSTGVSIYTDLSWAGGDPNPGDTVTYDVYFGTSSTPPKIASNKSTTSYDLGVLGFSTTYYWRIVAWDNNGASTQGPRWWFTTQGQQAGKPDLIVTDVWKQGQQLWYQLKNSGNASASGGHETALYIDNQFIVSDSIQVSMEPGERYTRFFSGYSWSCTQSNDTVRVVTDYQQDVTELNENNNERTETWKCDTTAPTITTGPTVYSITKHGAKIKWTTNEASDSHVSYGNKAGVFDHYKNASPLVLTHYSNLTSLLSGTTYHYQVESTDAHGNTVTSKGLYFTTKAADDAVNPVISFFNTTTTKKAQLPLKFFANVSDNVGVDRVEFYIDNRLFDTAYSMPFQGFLDPAYMNLSHNQLYNNHTFMARAYDQNDNSFIMQYEAAVPGPCNEVHLEIRSLLGGNAIIYTDDYQAHGNITLEVYAEENTGLSFLFDDMGRSHSRERWDPVEELDFYIDDDLVYSCAPDEKTISYEWNATGLGLGDHLLRVTATASDGCHHSTEVTFTVTQTQPEIRIEHEIDRVDTYFHMYFYLRSTGEEDAYPEDMTVHLTGYQAIQQDTDDYTVRPSYDPVDRKCNVEIEFDSGFVLAPFDVYTVEFLAVPIMYDGLDFNNLDIDIAYRDVHYDYHYDSFSDLDSWELLRDHAHEAFNESTYLIITNPTNLYAIYDADDVDLLLSKAAELAVLKHAVLGYYATFASLLTSYDSSDRVVTGNVRGDYHDEIVVLDNGNDQVAVYDARARINTIKYENLSHLDQLAVGNVYPTDIHTGDPHDYDEILVADAVDAFAHEITMYQVNLSRSWTFQLVGSFSTNFDSGDQVAVGDINSVGYDQIVIAHDEDGTIEIYDTMNPTPIQSFDSVFTSGDTLLVGNVDATSQDEINVVHVSDGRIYCYNSFGTYARYTLQPLSTDDSITLGDINSDTVMEILVADASAEEINTYGSAEEHLALDSHGSFQDCDALVAGDLFGDGDAELIVARAHRDYHRYPGEMDIFPFDGYREFDSRQALDDLINAGGSWAENMNDEWISDGYLLIIGEDEAIPSFSCREDGKTIRQTDRYYASTDVGESGRHRELSTGRIIGDNPEQLIKPIQVSIDIYNGDAEFDLSDALAVAGYSSCYNGKCDSIDFVGERNDVADKLDTIGFDVVDELTSYATRKPAGMNDSEFILQRRNLFFEHVVDKDLIHLAGHGSWNGWDLIEAYNVTMNYTVSDGHPLIYASSCNTGRYSEGYSFAERFFDKYISSYIGATEVSYCCPNTDLANRFYDRVLPGKSLGTSFMQAVNSHASGGPWYERDIRRYNSGIYHFYGDPTLTFGDVGAGTAEAETEQGVSTLGREEVVFTLPMYTVSSVNETDYVTIPGGGLVVYPGMPLVPSYTATVEYPAGYHINEVRLTNRSGMSTQTGLNLTTAVWEEAGGSLGDDGGDEQDAEVWPEDVFSWEVVHEAADATVLSITMYPFTYNNRTTEARYYRNYTFEVDGAAASVIITETASSHSIYEPGAPINVTVYLQNLVGQPLDVLVDAQIITENLEVVNDGLPLRLLRSLQGVASVSFGWNASGCTPGAYFYRISVCDLGGTVLDTMDHRFVVGVTAGVLANFTATPEVVDLGDDVELTLVFANTGTLSLDGIAVITIVSPDGAILQTDQYPFTGLSPGKPVSFTEQWGTAGLDGGDYQVSGYVLYDGLCTDVRGLKVSVNQPPNQPAKPTGPSTRLTGQAGNYVTNTTDPDDDQVQYRFDWNAAGNHEYSAWTSLVGSGQTVTKTHSWNSSGTYVVKTQARDEHGTVSVWSKGLTVTVTMNHAPNKPKKPTGPTTRLIGQAGTYWANGTDPDGDKIQYRFDWNASGSHSYSSWTSLVDSGTKLSKNHSWAVGGTYEVKVQSKDEHGVTSTWSNGLNVTVANHAPNQPKKPTGPTARVTGQPGTYWANGTDPDGDQIQYRFDWNASGSHSYSGWTLLVNSGTKLSMNHTWTASGTYIVKVQSKDEHGATSVWSNGLTVTVTVNHAPNQPKKPTGPTTRLVGQQGTYWANGTDPDGDQIQYRFDWNASGSHQYSAWTSLVNSGQKLSKNHSWAVAGTYVVKVQSRDEHGAVSVWSNGLTVIVHT